MKRQIITANFIQTICWEGDLIVDWSSGRKYSLDGKEKQFGVHWGWGDSVINSSDGKYIFIYKKLGTKGLIIKNGELLREINRPYYCSNAFEFPAAFITVENRTYLIHCPIAYNQLDFEDVETGEIITNIDNRKPIDRFHSRLEISPDGRWLMSKGWVWHPLDMIMVFDIKKCLVNPQLLDEPRLYPNVNVEVCTASFVDENIVVIGSSDVVLDEEEVGDLPPKHICLWNLRTDKLSKPVAIKENFGNLFAINSNCAWDLFDFPKIINLNTGEIIEQNEEINSGKQNSSIIDNTDSFPSIIFNKKTGQIAIKANEKIELLTPGDHPV
ncbi:hypothetical protein IDJ75_00145 [Mucilaginibacter rigui]|uniref:WD40 repeat domain-containing protein n=1 Tax=Mucilaginibacter rigui TaxID=534635 RepID=A0ABR7WZI5_9SPHI|nr:hypothetical protein [Mucilaginibacter rigui]MBD1383671.1 hypothetical protein [Mucilaginibacter rigui]